MEPSFPKKLSTLFRELINKKNWTISLAADELEVSDASLRTWLRRNCFPQLEAERLAKALGLTTREIKALPHNFEVRWTRPSKLQQSEQDNLGDVFVSFDRKLVRLRAPLEKFARRHGLLFRAMNVGDLYVCASSTVTPAEFDVTAPTFCDLAAGLYRGATVVYLRPDSDVIRTYYERYSFVQILFRDEMEAEFDRCRAELEAALRKAHRLPAEKASDIVRRQMHQFFVEERNHFPFWMPGFVVSMFHTTDRSMNPKRRMIVRLPGEHYSPLYLGEYTVLDDRFGRAVLKVMNEKLSHGTKTDDAKEALVNIKRILEAKGPRPLRHT